MRVRDCKVAMSIYARRTLPSTLTQKLYKVATPRLRYVGLERNGALVIKPHGRMRDGVLVICGEDCPYLAAIREH